LVEVPSSKNQIIGVSYYVLFNTNNYEGTDAGKIKFILKNDIFQETKNDKLG